MNRSTTNLPGLLTSIVLSVLLVTGCGNDDTPPKSTLSEEQMATILTEIHLAESRVNRMQLRSLDSSLMIFNRLKSDIWKKYKVDTLAYRESYSYYMTHPKTMARIYENVNRKIERREKTNDIKL